MEVDFAITYHPVVIHEHIPKLEHLTKARVQSAIEEKLRTHPDTYGKPLRRSLKGHRTLRVGDYRIIFKIIGHTVYILAILHRSIIYKEMGKRS